MEASNPFSPAFCAALLRLFWICYRHGLEDACGSGDPGECEEAVVRLRGVRNLGTVGCGMDWNEWQFKVLQWTRDDICRKRTMDLVMAMRRPGHKLGFLLQIAKMYYVRGVSDWMECSDWLTKGMVSQMPNYPYLLKRARSFRKSVMRERFEMLQGECFNLIAVHDAERAEGGEYLVPSARVRMLVERVWSAMQRPQWFDDYDVEAYAWDEIGEKTDLKKICSGKAYGKKKDDRRVPRKDEGRGDAAADGALLQPGAPRRRPGRPPKNV